MQSTKFADYHTLRAEFERLLPEAFHVKYIHKISSLDAHRNEIGLKNHVMRVLKPRESMHQNYPMETALQLLRETKAERDHPREDSSSIQRRMDAYRSAPASTGDSRSRRMNAYKR